MVFLFIPMLIILMLVLFILVLTLFIAKSKNRGNYAEDEYIPGEIYNYSIQERYFTIEALNMKLIILPLIVSFVTVSLLFGIIIMAETEIPVLSDTGKEIMNGYAVWFIQFIIIQLMFFILFALFKKIQITVENGTLYINGVIQDIRYYQVKKIFAENSLFYLKTERKLWILLPSTTEGLRKYPRKDILKKQTEELNNNIDIIERILSGSDAEYKKFGIIRNLLFGFGGTFILLTVISLGMLMSKYYL